MTRVPVDALVLDQEHLATTTAELQRADDAVVQHLADILVRRRVHYPERRVEQPLLFVSREATVANRFGLLVHPNTDRLNGDRANKGGACVIPQFIAARSRSSTRCMEASSTSSA